MIPKKFAHTNTLHGTELAKRRAKDGLKNTAYVAEAVVMSPRNLYRQITEGSTTWIKPFSGQQRSVKRAAHLQALQADMQAETEREAALDAYKRGNARQFRPGHTIDEKKATAVLAVYQEMHQEGKLSDDELNRETQNLRRGYVWAHQLTNHVEATFRIGQSWLEKNLVGTDNQLESDHSSGSFSGSAETFFTEFRPAHTSEDAANEFFKYGRVGDRFRV